MPIPAGTNGGVTPLSPTRPPVPDGNVFAVQAPSSPKRDDGPRLTKETFELVNLNPPLAQYNGRVTRVYMLDIATLPNGGQEQQFKVDLSDHLSLELPARNLRALSEFEVPIVPGRPTAGDHAITLNVCYVAVLTRY
jgi:hypothetical protein